MGLGFRGFSRFWGGVIRGSLRGSYFWGFTGAVGVFGFLEGSYGTFRKLGGTLFWGPNNKDPTILGSPSFGNPHMTLVVGCFPRLDQLRVLDNLSALLVPVLMLL